MCSRDLSQAALDRGWQFEILGEGRQLALFAGGQVVRPNLITRNGYHALIPQEQVSVCEGIFLAIGRKCEAAGFRRSAQVCHTAPVPAALTPFAMPLYIEWK